MSTITIWTEPIENFGKAKYTARARLAGDTTGTVGEGYGLTEQEAAEIALRDLYAELAAFTYEEDVAAKIEAEERRIAEEVI